MIVPALVGAISIDPAPDGLIWTWPVPVGLMSIWAFVPFMFVDTSSDTLLPPPEPHWSWAVPEAFRNAPPAEVAASKYGPTNLVVAVMVVPAIVFAVVFPMVGGLDKSSVPPKVKFPELVTVPDRLIPETVPVPPTLVTVPVVGVAHDGTPPARVNTCPFEPVARKVVVPEAVW